MDQGQRLSRLPGQGDTLTGECDSCVIAQRLATGDTTRSETAYIAEDIDEDVVVMSGPQLDGLAIVPRQHVAGLEELPDRRRAHVLAALRRATESVRERNPGSVTRILVMSGPPASEGHVCFHVVPKDPEEPGGSTTSPA